MKIKHSIMIVDDNPTNLQVLGDILELANYTVRPAISGEIALQSITAALPDLILLDVRMPGMDGFEVSKCILGNEKTRHIPIIFISALIDINDKLAAFKAGALDYITKPFHPEEVLVRVNTQLELSRTRKELHANNERLLALMEQLVQSEKLKSLGSLAAGVAHELNTPIGNALLTVSALDNSVRDYLRNNRTQPEAEKLQALLDTCSECSLLITRNLERAGKLVRSLRDIATDQSSERRRKLVLRDCVNDLIATMKFSLNKTGHTINNNIAPELILDTYPGRLEQVLENLITNAILHAFSEKKHGSITFAAEKSAENKIVLSVSDNGQGIAEENLKRVFDPFFTTRLGQGGSGLGLHIVYTLVTGVLGGAISLDSTLRVGTTFTITLPAEAPMQN